MLKDLTITDVRLLLHQENEKASTFDTETPEQYRDSLIALGQEGGGFREYAAAQLMHTIRLARHLDWSVCYWMLISALSRGDTNRCRQNLIDWQVPSGRLVANITRFRPGKHFHTLGETFATAEAAERYIYEKGYRVGKCFDVEARRPGDYNHVQKPRNPYTSREGTIGVVQSVVFNNLRSFVKRRGSNGIMPICSEYRYLNIASHIRKDIR